MPKIVALLALLVPALAAAQPSFTGLGDLPGGAVGSRAYDVSGDGSAVVGASESASGTEAFRWSGGVLEGLGDLPTGDFSSTAFAVSADGAVVVGSGTGDPFGADAFRWTAAGMVGLTPPPMGLDLLLATAALGASGDGARVAGLGSEPFAPGCGFGNAFEWTAGGGTVGVCVPLTDRTETWDVSSDGSAVVGSLTLVELSPQLVHRNYEAVEFTTVLGTDFVPGRALATSADGSVIVGEGETFGGMGAFRWVETPATPGRGTLALLGGLPGGSGASFPWDVTAGGGVVVGSSDTGAGCENSLQPTGLGTAGCRAFVWDTAHGMRALSDLLETDYGLELGGWTLIEARGISDDGRTVVGWGIHPLGHEEAWVATLPPACDDGLDNDADGLVDLADTGCDDGVDASEQTATWPCDDGVDNDGDGGVDFRPGGGGDVGCRDPAWIETPQCQDGVNNDPGLDAFIDFDGGASAGVPPAQQTAPDPQCSAAWDNRERPPPACGLGFELAPALAAFAALRRRRGR